MLEDDNAIQKILNDYPDKKKETHETYQKNREERIKKVLNLAGLKTEKEYDLYKCSLEASKNGY